MSGKTNDSSRLAKKWLALAATATLLAGAFFTIGGAGLALLAPGVLIARRRPAGALVYRATCLLTIV